MCFCRSDGLARAYRVLIARVPHALLGGVHDERVDRTYAVGDTMARAGNAAPEIVYNVNAG